MKTKRIFVIVLLFILLGSFVIQRCSKAEEYPVPTFNIPEPSPTEEPIPEPIFEEGSPPPIVNSPPYNTRIAYRQYEWIKVKGSPGSYLYTYNGKVGSTAPSFINLAWSENMSIGKSLYYEKAAIHYLRGGYTYDFQLRYRQEQVPPGYMLSFYFQDPKFWFDSVVDGPSGEEISVPLQAQIYITVGFSDGSKSTEFRAYDLSQINDGITFEYTNRSNYDISFADVSLIYKMADSVVSFPSTKEDVLCKISSDSTLTFKENVVLSPEKQQQADFLQNYELTLGNLFVPDETMFNSWVQSLVSQNDLGGFALPHDLYIKILEKFSSLSEAKPPQIEIPPLSLTVDGGKYQFFDGYTFDFKDLPENIFVYSRMAGSIVIVGCFVRYIWSVFRKLFGQKTSSTEDGD